MTRFATLLGCFLALAAVDDVQAGRFDTVEYECKQFAEDANTTILCAVGDHMGRPALFMKVLVKPTDQPKRIERARYLVGVMTHNFYAVGGTQTLTRSVDKSGRMIERFCSRHARAPNGACGDWYPIADQK